MKARSIYCCGCMTEVNARLTDESEIYPHLSNLHSKPFWKCDTCGAYCGCHHKTKDKTRPLGNLADEKMRDARKHIHKVLDPIWKRGSISRKDVYKMIS